MVKLGTHEKPRTEVNPSKERDFKNISLILVQNGKQKKLKKQLQKLECQSR
jgi:hypothetical protein